MSERTGIAWTDATWNPVRGCSRVSPGCERCYAERMAGRFSGPGQPFAGFVRRTAAGEARWTGKVRLVSGALDEPRRWREPRRVFVNSMSDLFHESLTDREIAQVFAAMAVAQKHQFQALTKRAERMCAWFDWADGGRRVWEVAGWLTGPPWPLAHVWLGVSVEDQRRADERVPRLLACPAAVRWVSVEPMLGPIDLSRWLSDTPSYETDGQRRDGLSGSDSRGTGGGQAGSRVESEVAPWHSMGRGGSDGSLSPSPCRESHGPNLPPGACHGQLEAHSLYGASPSLATRSRPDSARPDGESPERSERRQPSGQPRTSNVLRADETRLSHGPERRERGEEPRSEIDRQGCPGDPTRLRAHNDNTSATGRQVHRLSPEHLEDRSGRTTTHTEGTDGRLFIPETEVRYAERQPRQILWVVCGGESGPGYRPCEIEWIESIVEQCRAAGASVFVKQDSGPRPGQWGRIPERLRIREMPG